MNKNGCFLLGIMFICITPCYAGPASPKQLKNTEAGVAQFRVQDAVFDKRKVPIALFQAIAGDAKSRKLRISWGYNAASADTQGTVLYDRDNKTVKYWLRDITEFGVKTQSSLYHDVSDEIISTIGKGFEEDINDFELPQGNYYLDRLMKHGCKKTILQDSFTEWPKR